MDGPRHLKASRLVPILKLLTCSVSCHSSCSIPGPWRLQSTGPSPQHRQQQTPSFFHTNNHFITSTLQDLVLPFTRCPHPSSSLDVTLYHYLSEIPTSALTPSAFHILLSATRVPALLTIHSLAFLPPPFCTHSILPNHTLVFL